jgi:hypothetical protein
MSESDLAQFGAKLESFKAKAEGIESEIQGVISRLLDQRSEIEASGKLLAILHSQCLTLGSSIAEIQALLSNRLHAD